MKLTPVGRPTCLQGWLSVRHSPVDQTSQSQQDKLNKIKVDYLQNLLLKMLVLKNTQDVPKLTCSL